MDHEISEAVLSILNGGGMSSFLNSTFIALILKTCNAVSICDF